jgi:hypothetical protein
MRQSKKQAKEKHISHCRPGGEAIHYEKGQPREYITKHARKEEDGMVCPKNGQQ